MVWRILGRCFWRNDIAGCILLSCVIIIMILSVSMYRLYIYYIFVDFSSMLFSKFISCFFADWPACTASVFFSLYVSFFQLKDLGISVKKISMLDFNQIAYQL